MKRWRALVDAVVFWILLIAIMMFLVWMTGRPPLIPLP